LGLSLKRRSPIGTFPQEKSSNWDFPSREVFQLGLSLMLVRRPVSVLEVLLVSYYKYYSHSEPTRRLNLYQSNREFPFREGLQLGLSLKRSLPIGTFPQEKSSNWDFPSREVFQLGLSLKRRSSIGTFPHQKSSIGSFPH
jgi:hypothetical protein